MGDNSPLQVLFSRESPAPPPGSESTPPQVDTIDELITLCRGVHISKSAIQGSRSYSFADNQRLGESVMLQRQLKNVEMARSVMSAKRNKALNLEAIINNLASKKEEESQKQQEQQAEKEQEEVSNPQPEISEKNTEEKEEEKGKEVVEEKKEQEEQKLDSNQTPNRDQIEIKQEEKAVILEVKEVNQEVAEVVVLEGKEKEQRPGPVESPAEKSKENTGKRKFSVSSSDSETVFDSLDLLLLEGVSRSPTPENLNDAEKAKEEDLSTKHLPKRPRHEESVPAGKIPTSTSIYDDFGYSIAAEEAADETTDEIAEELTFLVEKIGVTKEKEDPFMPYWS